MKEKLIDYRLNGYNHFMDQDTLNVVFAGKVLYLPIYYNAMYSTVNHFKEKDIYEYYDLKKVETREEICANSYIIHLCSPTKPWKYRDSWHSNEWYGYYKKSPFKNRLLFRKIFNQPKTTREKAIKLLYNGMARVHQEGVVSTCKFVIKKVLPFQ